MHDSAQKKGVVVEEEEAEDGEGEKEGRKKKKKRKTSSGDVTFAASVVKTTPISSLDGKLVMGMSFGAKGPAIAAYKAADDDSTPMWADCEALANADKKAFKSAKIRASVRIRFSAYQRLCVRILMLVVAMAVVVTVRATVAVMAVMAVIPPPPLLLLLLRRVAVVQAAAVGPTNRLLPRLLPLLHLTLLPPPIARGRMSLPRL